MQQISRRDFLKLAAAAVLFPKKVLAEPIVKRAEARIEINIPAFRLDVFAGEKKIKSFAVAVGRKEYQTPAGSFPGITSITYDPPWIPPKSKWARKYRPMRPGPANPMGKAKAGFGELLYIHGTNEPASIGKAASHGCIRMRNEDILELGSMLERLVGGTRRGNTFQFSRPVPVKTRYSIAEAFPSPDMESVTLFFYRDIYGLKQDMEKEAERALADAGIPVQLLPGGANTIGIFAEAAESKLKTERSAAFTVPLGWRDVLFARLER